MAKLHIATRASKLAVWQAEFVARQLKSMGQQADLLRLQTEGDRVQDRFLHEIGGKGIFIKELEEALLRGSADLAVHSLKDMPAVTQAPFALAAILRRHSARDVLIFHPDTYNRLKPPAVIDVETLRQWGPLTIATSSLRRTNLLKLHAPALNVIPLRGNIDTRIRKLHDEKWDAIVLAEAGIVRLGLDTLPHSALDPSWFVPSPAQGALVVETIADSAVYGLVRRLNHDLTEACVTIEREVLRQLGGDCEMPIGCHVWYDVKENRTRFAAVVLDGKGQAARASGFTDTDPRHLFPIKTAQRIIAELTKDGLDQVLISLRSDRIVP